MHIPLFLEYVFTGSIPFHVPCKYGCGYSCQVAIQIISRYLCWRLVSIFKDSATFPKPFQS